MRVQKTPVEFHCLGDQSGARVLYVTYRAVQKNDYKGIEDTDFVMVGDDQWKVTP
jgi:predicted amidohydrolase YtcJ